MHIILDYLFKKRISYAQYLQDVFIDLVFFNGKRNGFYLDIGAYDGIKFSNSYYFEKYNNWQGLLVEPNHEIFKSLIKNRSGICINALVSNRNETVDYLRITGEGEMLSGIIQNFDELHVKRVELNLEKNGGNKYMEKIQSFTPSHILEKFNVTNIDMMSIDTEGSELIILQSFPFHIIKPRIILVENNYKKTEYRNYLISLGYTYQFKLGDEVYTLDNKSMSVKIKTWIFRAFKKIKLFKISN